MGYWCRGLGRGVNLYHVTIQPKHPDHGIVDRMDDGMSYHSSFFFGKFRDFDDVKRGCDMNRRESLANNVFSRFNSLASATYKTISPIL
jgi:hypothetical protein